MKIQTAFTIGGFVCAGIAAALLLRYRNQTTSAEAPAATASAPVAGAVMAGDKQVVEVFAKEGYQPREISAKAGVPTVLKIRTQDTFDCSTAFTIPKLGVRTNLEPTGVKEFEIPAQKAGEKIYGVCGMGMYSFSINFN